MDGEASAAGAGAADRQGGHQVAAMHADSNTSGEPEKQPTPEGAVHGANLPPPSDFIGGESTAPLTGVDSSPTARMRRHFPRIEGYQIVGVVGQGGMGIVYQAVQTKLNRTVALKVLPAIVGSANPAAVERFRREATAAARLHHSHIIPIYDFGESGDAYYYAMELVRGQPLNKVIHAFSDMNVESASATRLADVIRTTVLGSSPDLPMAGLEIVAMDESTTGIGSSSAGRGRAYFRHVAKWIADAADALHYAHGQGIIHRDIKPANLIISTDGRIMVADFGLAKEVGEDSVTMTGSLLGTLRYVSPEQAMAKRVRVDHRTDVYSLGATMYELLCFQPAYTGRDDKEILGAIIAKEPTSPRKILHAVPFELETICLKAMEKSPDARYDTGRAFAEDLRRYIQDLPIVARRPGAVTRTVKFVRRRKAPVIAVTAAILVAASSWYAVRWRERSRREEAMRLKAEVEALYQEGFSFQRNGRPQQAIAAWNRALEIDPNHVETALAMIWIKFSEVAHANDDERDSLLEEVAQLCDRVLQVHPDNANALNYQGVALRRLRRFDEAVDVLKRCVQYAPQHYACWANLGNAFAVSGRHEEAGRHLQEGANYAGIIKDPWVAAVWRNLASYQLHTGDSAAVESVNNAVECDKTASASWTVRARVRMQLQGHVDFPSALDAAKHADMLADSKDPKAKRVRALAHLKNDEFEQAAEHATAAIALGDMPTINHLACAVAYATLTQQQEAQRELYLADDKWPTELEAEEAVHATADGGVLWYDTAAELDELRRQAALLIENAPPKRHRAPPGQ